MQKSLISQFNEISNIVKEYKKIKITDTSIFQNFSKKYYEENFHSRILTFYFNFYEVKEELIKFINSKLKLNIPFQIYKYGEVIAEAKRVDIHLKSENNKRVIIIENKSNYAKDQLNQIPRYVNMFEKEKITVDAILYINLSENLEPNFNKWKINTSKKEELKNKLICTNLVTESSINIIFKNIAKFTEVTNNRLSQLSKEIDLFFTFLVKGELIMNDKILKELFEKIKKENSILEQIKNIHLAYNDLPIFLAQQVVKSLEEFCNENNIDVENENENFIALSLKLSKLKNSWIVLEINTSLSKPQIYFGCWNQTKQIRIPKQEKIIINEMGKDFPFKEEISVNDPNKRWNASKSDIIFWGENLTIHKLFNIESKLKNQIKKIMETFIKYNL